MIVSETPNRMNAHWLQTCVLLFAVAVVPLGAAYAQDYEAVEKRLGEAVSNGELTLEQASAMMAVLKEMPRKSKSTDERHVYLEQVWAKLQAAVAAGKMSSEEAEAKMAAIKKAKLGDGKARKKKDAHKKALADQLKAAVKAGKLTEEEALAKWKRISGDHDDDDHDLEAIWKKLQAMVKAGKLTEKQAHAKMAAIKKKATQRKDNKKGQRD